MYWDHEPCETENPKGIPPSSPGLRGTSYPGFKAPNFHNPEGVAPGVHSPSVHGKPPFAPRSHPDHESPWSSPSPPLEERGERRSLFRCSHGGEEAIWNLVLGASLGFGVWDLELPWRSPSQCMCEPGVGCLIHTDLPPSNYQNMNCDHLSQTTGNSTQLHPSATQLHHILISSAPKYIPSHPPLS